MPATLLSISAFAKKTGLSRQTLIYYDRLGVLPCYQRQENGYRYYHPDQIFQAARLQFWQSLGYSLEKIKGLFNQEDHWQAPVQLAREIQSIDQQMAQLTKMRQYLVDKLNQNRGDPMPISEVWRLQDVHFTAILSGYLQDHTPLYDYPDGAILTRQNDEWFIQLFRYASHTPPTLTETLDIPLTYQEIDQLDDINSFLSCLHKQYSFQPEPPFYLEVHYLDQSQKPDFILRILTQKVIQSK